VLRAGVDPAEPEAVAVALRQFLTA
jgi:hypothetical protein